MVSKKIIIAGGGTGGHIFPAIAIARALQQKQSDIDLLFIGAKGKMEMEKIPGAGYKIIGIDVAGLNRSSLIKNVGLPLKLIKSFIQVRSAFKSFKPDGVVGVGGYSTFPVLKYAQTKGIPTFIHESNSFPGKANKMLAKRATKILTGAEGPERFFPIGKTVFTGNPVRKEIIDVKLNKTEACAFFGMQPDKITLLVVGGSLGAKTINEALLYGVDRLLKAGMQIIWQTGKSFSKEAAEKLSKHKEVWINEFIYDMEYAYKAADMIVARAGAMTVAEVAVVQKPAIFVPYPFAAEDHQTENAKQLVNKNAALMVTDREAKNKITDMILALAADGNKRKEMERNLSNMAVTNADERIAHEILASI